MNTSHKIIFTLSLAVLVAACSSDDAEMKNGGTEEMESAAEHAAAGVA